MTDSKYPRDKKLIGNQREPSMVLCIDIHNLLRIRGMSQAELAMRLNRDASSLSRSIKNWEKTSFDLICQSLEALDFVPALLLFKREEMSCPAKTCLQKNNGVIHDPLSFVMEVLKEKFDCTIIFQSKQ